MYDRILLPTDGSASMRPVIDHAAALADHHDATIHALYVLDTATLTRLPMETNWEVISDMLQQEGNSALEGVAERTQQVPVEESLVEGSPSKEIVAYAEEYDVDVIVMGTHGRGGLDRLLLGSVAERVVRTSPVPVMTVRVNGEQQSEDSETTVEETAE